MNHLYVGIFMFGAIGTVSCGSKSGNGKIQQSLSDRVASSAFLTTSDMEPPADLPQLNAVQAKTVADEWDIFSPNTSGLTDSAPLNVNTSCIDQIFDALEEATYTAAGPLLTLSFEKTVDNCNFAGEPGGKASIKSAMAVACDGGEFSSMSGKKSGTADIPQEKICSNATEIQVIHNLEVVVEWSSNSQNFKSVQKTGMMGNDGRACVFKKSGDVTSSSGCTEFNLTESPEGRIFKKAVYESITDTFSQKTLYHTGGKMKLTLNNWTGEATFPGASSSPVWTLSNGMVTIKNGSAAFMP